MPESKPQASLGVSVIVCCHDSAARLPETLAHLARQKVDPGIPWEVLSGNHLEGHAEFDLISYVCHFEVIPLDRPGGVQASRTPDLGHY